MRGMALNWEREAFMHLPGPEGAHRKLWGGLHGKGGSDGMRGMALNWEREAFMHLPGLKEASERTLGDDMEA